MTAAVSSILAPTVTDSASAPPSSGMGGVFALLINAPGAGTPSADTGSGAEDSSDLLQDGSPDDPQASLIWADLALMLTPLNPPPGNASEASSAATATAEMTDAVSLTSTATAEAALGAIAEGLTPASDLAAPAKPIDLGLAGMDVLGQRAKQPQPAEAPAAALISGLSAAKATPSAQPAAAIAALSGADQPVPGLVLSATAAEGETSLKATNNLPAAITTKLLELTKFADAGPDQLPTPTAPTGQSSAEHATARLELSLPPGAAPRMANAFADGMAARIGWMAEQNMGKAEIRLHPDDLGSIEVNLQMDAKSVRIEFLASNAEARHLLESSLSRLRDLFSAQGLNLSHADVGQSGAESQPRRERGETPAQPLAGPKVVSDTGTSSPRAGRSAHTGPGLSEYA